MLSIVYASSAATTFTEEELHDLLETSRVNNAKLDITGMLLYKDGNFIQAIEGPEEAVRSLYAKIAQDSRHKEIFLLSEETITERNFPNWSMGFKSMINLPDDIPGFSSFLQPGDTSLVEVFRRKRKRALIFLLAFRDNIR